MHKSSINAIDIDCLCKKEYIYAWFNKGVDLLGGNSLLYE